MTTEARTARHPIEHPPWCQSDRCVITDGAAIHRHLFGSVGGVEVTVERIDTLGDNGRVKRGPAKAWQHYNGSVALGLKEAEQLNRLHRAAALFAGQSKEGVV